MRTPAGVEWRVGRRWLPRRPPRRRINDAGFDVLDVVGFIDEPSGILLAIGLVVVATALIAIMVLFVLPLLILALDLLLIALLLVGGVFARVVLRRPWTVVAVNRAAKQTTSWNVVGWRRSGAWARTVADRLQLGEPVDAIQPARDPSQ